MSIFRKISNGLEMQGCDLYHYLLTEKGYCCEKGWNWEDLDTQQVMQGRQWLAYWEEYGDPCSDTNVPVIVTNPVISGSVGVGNTLTSTTGVWYSDTGVTGYTYQWYRGVSAISGATNNTYVVQLADVDESITCQVIASDSDGQSLPATSNAILISTTPTNSVAPAISGVQIVGQTLTTTNGTWSAIGAITYSYQWQRGGVNIGGATSLTYTLVQADAGQNITCQVTATTLAGMANATSAGSVILATIIDVLGTSIKGAYSSFLLRGAYYGSPCVSVRRSGDSAEFNFGFTTAGVLDTSAIVAFCVAGGGTQSGFIVTMFDQSTAGNNLTQTTPSYQPSIVTNGVLLVTNTKPAFSSLSSDFLTVPSSTSTFKFLHDGTDSMVVAVTKVIAVNSPIVRTMTTSATSSVGYLGGDNSGNRLQSAICNGGGSSNSVAHSTSTSYTTIGNQILFVDEIDANNATASNRSCIYMNGGTAVKNNTLTTAPSSASSSNDLRVLTGATQEFQEVLIFDSRPNLTTLRSNINSRFNIY